MCEVVTISDGEHRYSYEKTEEPKKGSCGTVYKGIEESTSMPVAVKIYKKIEQKDDFYEREIGALNQIQNKNYRYVLKSCSWFEDEENRYLITRYCEGGTLKDFLKFVGPTGPSGYILAVEAIYQLAKGVQALHSQGILHLDITLSNVMLSNGQCKIGDFGSAAKRPEDFDPHYRAAPSYKAPEVRGSRSICICSACCKEFCWKLDVWSLGVIFYKMLFGKEAYLQNEKQLLEMGNRDQRFPKRPKKSRNKKNRIKSRKFPRQVMKLLDKMLRVDHRERYNIEQVMNDRLFKFRRTIFAPNSAPAVNP